MMLSSILGKYVWVCKEVQPDVEEDEMGSLLTEDGDSSSGLGYAVQDLFEGDLFAQMARAMGSGHYGHLKEPVVSPELVSAKHAVLGTIQGVSGGAVRRSESPQLWWEVKSLRRRLIRKLRFAGRGLGTLGKWVRIV